MAHQQNIIGENAINRRTAIGALGGVTALGMLQGALAQDGADHGAPPTARDPFDLHALGWDQTRGEYVLPKLPYDYNALEPHIDEQTMRIHHDKHHAGYVKGANKAMQELARIRGTGDGGADQALIKHWARELSFHLGGHVNHTIFWHCMAKPAKGVGGEAIGPVGDAINRDFGSFNAFSSQFQAAANVVEGSGWGWLCYEPVAQKLIILQMEKQQDMLSANVRPILGVDVWEHAYYIKYQNKRADYTAAFMNLINWNTVNALYTQATRGVTRAW